MENQLRRELVHFGVDCRDWTLAPREWAVLDTRSAIVSPKVDIEQRLESFSSGIFTSEGTMRIDHHY